MLFLGLGLFGLYLYSAYPALSPYRDAGDMAASALSLGVAHPPGYPLYLLLSHAWLDLFPLGNAAFRLQVLSALLGVAAALALMKSLERDGPGAGVAAFLFLALAPAFWHLSVVSEMYSLNACLAAGLLWLGTRGSDVRLGALGSGLGLGNHQSLALALPGLAWMRRRQLMKPQGLIPFFLLGLALYAYLPLRARTYPALDWGEPATLRGFLRMLTRADYGNFRLVPGRPAGLWDLSAWGAGSALAAGAFLKQLGIAGSALMVWGAWARRRSQAAQGCLLAFLLTGPLFIVWANLDNAQAESWAILEPHLVLPLVFAAALAGWGAADLLARVSGAARPALVSALAALWLVPRQTASGAIHRGDYSAWDHGRGLADSLEPGAVLLDPDDPTAFGLSYLLHAEGRRPDVTPLLYFRTRWGYEQLKRRHGELLPSWEIRSGQELARTVVEKSLEDGRPLYTDLPLKAPPGLAVVALGLGYRVLPPSLKAAENLRFFQRGKALSALLRVRPAPSGDFFTRHTVAYWASALNNLGIEAERLGRLQEAAALYRRSLAVTPELAEAWNNLGNAELELKNAEAAEGCYLASVRLKPTAPVVYNLGRIYLLSGRYAQAQAQFKRALLMADLPDAENDLGLVYLRGGRTEEAVGLWLNLLSRHPDYALAYYNLAQAYERLGRKADAVRIRAVYRQLVRKP